MLSTRSSNLIIKQLSMQGSPSIAVEIRPTICSYPDLRFLDPESQNTSFNIPTGPTPHQDQGPAPGVTRVEGDSKVCRTDCARKQ